EDQYPLLDPVLQAAPSLPARTPASKNCMAARGGVPLRARSSALSPAGSACELSCSSIPRALPRMPTPWTPHHGGSVMRAGVSISCYANKMPVPKRNRQGLQRRSRGPAGWRAGSATGISFEAQSGGGAGQEEAGMAIWHLKLVDYDQTTSYRADLTLEDKG